MRQLRHQSVLRGSELHWSLRDTEGCEFFGVLGFATRRSLRYLGGLRFRDTERSEILRV